jgi:hypothetical protein
MFVESEGQSVLVLVLAAAYSLSIYN